MKPPSQDPSAWMRIATCLDQALDLEPSECAVWLDELEKSQADIAGTVREMLGQRESLKASGFLEGSPLPSTPLDTFMPALEEMMQRHMAADSGNLLEQLPNFAESIAAENRLSGIVEGEVLGPYRLIREIGHGGMSCVWLAERGDGAIKRQIALKLPFAGAWLAQMAQRFKRERDILGSLTHPNIARLYDAGVAESGQPYLAMEYVDGTALTLYCDAGRLSIRERLKIFLQVLSAVEFAHSQLVLHRDLKPSNILVTREGRVVLLDFGIAKLLSQDGDAIQLTEMASRILTPDYASPEHIAGRSLGTTSDVYSLGVVLHELLAGVRPFASRHQSRRALEEAILTQDPPRLGQLTLRQEVAAARGTTPRKLVQMFRGDLETIVLKALRHVPIERYGSINAFAQDIANYIEGKPVSARPDSKWYRFRRFVSRHKLQVIAVSVAGLAIVLGGATALWQARAAAQERDRAVSLASRNAAINEFMSTLIADAASTEKTVTVAEMLVRSETLAMADTHESDENRAAILGVIGGLLYSRSGDVGKAAQLLERALVLAGEEDDSGLRSHLVCEHAVMIADMGRIDEAKADLDAQIANPELDATDASTCLGYRAHIALATGDADAAVRYATEALDRLHASARATLLDEGTLLGVLAESHHSKGDNASADRYFELALQKYAEAGREKSTHATILANNWGQASFGAGAPRRALILADQMLSAAPDLYPDGRPPAAVLHNRARALEAVGRYKEARDAYALCRDVASDTKSRTYQTSCLVGLASVAEQLGDRPAAMKYIDEVNALLGAPSTGDNPLLMRLAVLQGKLKLAAGKPADAVVDFEWVLGKKRKSGSTVGAAVGKAEAQLASGDTAGAVAAARIAVSIATSLQGGVQYSNYTGLAWTMLGRALRASGEMGQARNAFETAVAHLSNTVDADHPELLRAREMLASSV